MITQIVEAFFSLALRQRRLLNMTKRIVATVGGSLVAFVVYLFLWFIVRNMVAGISLAISMAIHAAVAAISIWAGICSYRSSMR
jgi:CHASE2 domain-containing sensor protein